MNRIPNTQDRHGTTGASRRSGRRWQQWWPGRRMLAGPWLVVLVVAAALVASGCGGGGGDEEEESEPATEAEPADMGGPAAGMPAQPKPKAKEQAKAEEEVGPLPEEISEWGKEHYYQARKDGDLRLPEAIAYLGEHFAGTPQADTAAQLLTNLLEKSEEPEPKPGAKRPPASMPGMESSMPGMEADAAGMEADMAADMAGMEQDQYAGGMPPGMEEEAGSSRMPGLRGGLRGRGPNVELINAVVNALGLNGSATAKQTLKQVVEGTFETDDNRAATLATLQTLVSYLCTEYEDLLFRCLTTPDKLRALGKAGQTGRMGGMPYGGPSGAAYGEESSMEAEGMYASPGMGRPGSGPLTAEELQRQAFEWIAPRASEEFRAKIARHLANPKTPQEDLDLFGPYLRESHPDNLQAQMVLYFAPGMDTQTKETIEDNFLAYSSDALAGILGIPAEQRAEAARQRERRQSRGPRYSGMPGEPGMEESYMEEENSGAMMEEMSAEEGVGMPPAGVGGVPGRTRTGRPSRYDAQSASGRPSRYDGRQGAGRQQAAPEPDAFEMGDPDLPYRLAQHMWGSEMTKLVENRLTQVSSLEGQAPLVLLASTMPVDSTRLSLYRLLQQHWKDGPGALESAGLFDHVISDPGFLALVKMLPRKALEEPKRAVPTLSRMRTRRTGRGQDDRRGAEDAASGAPGDMEASDPAGRMGPPGAGRGQGKPQEPDLAWMTASEELLRVVCERLLAAAQATGGGQAAEGLPFKMREDALVTAELHLDWPGSQPEKLAGVSLGQMKLHYVRAECQTKVSTLESFYTRQLGSADVRPVQDGSWIDSVQPVPDTNVKRSIDLLLTATVPAGEEFDKKQELPVTLDILCIDIKDPAPGGEGN
ncbi:MAG TPA: hypothetical protein VMY37_00360 [Thermoguttaceae bacterium]|nr:hypothetical protein [Thermoguttaceae bacterium]